MTLTVKRSTMITWLIVLGVVIAVLALRGGGFGLAGAEAAEVTDGRDVAAQTAGEDAVQPASHTAGHELLLNLVEPCVVFDTREGGGKLAAGQNRTLSVVGPTRDLSAQGGSAGGCGITNDAQAVLINVVAIEPEGGGNLRAHAGDLPPQGGSGVVNYQKFADNLNNSNQIVLRVRQAGKGVDDVLIGANGAGVHVRGIVSGYYTAFPGDRLAAMEARMATLESANTALQGHVSNLESANTALQGRVSNLEGRLAGVTRSQVGGRDTLRFTGMNLQIVNGTNSTDGAPNGVGNLIVGYNEQRPLGPTRRSGSHNLVVGDRHEWTHWGGIVVGIHNSILNEWASVAGGRDNIASGEDATVSGGYTNQAAGRQSSVSGGHLNAASGFQSSVSGGLLNHATGMRSSVSGGEGNAADGAISSVSGGELNTAAGGHSSILGGFARRVDASYGHHPN